MAFHFKIKEDTYISHAAFTVFNFIVFMSGKFFDNKILLTAGCLLMIPLLLISIYFTIRIWKRVNESYGNKKLLYSALRGIMMSILFIYYYFYLIQ